MPKGSKDIEQMPALELEHPRFPRLLTLARSVRNGRVQGLAPVVSAEDVAG